MSSTKKDLTILVFVGSTAVLARKSILKQLETNESTVSANRLLFLSSLIPSLSLMSMSVFGFMDSSLLKEIDSCNWYILSHAFSVLFLFHSSHNNSVGLSRMRQLVIRLSQLLVLRLHLYPVLYVAVIKVCLQRRLHLVYYRTKQVWRRFEQTVPSLPQDVTLQFVSISTSLRPAVNVMSKCFLWTKPLFVTGETPIHRGYFLSPDERRQQNIEARRVKRMKMPPDEAAQARHIDRIRWIERGIRCNETKHEKHNSRVICEGTSSLVHTADITRQTTFQHIIHVLKLTAAKALHLTNTDLSNQTNPTHKSLVCLICDCFIMTTSSKVTIMSMADIKKHRCRLGVKTYEDFQGVRLHKDLVAQYIVPGFTGMLLSPRSRNNGSGGFAVCARVTN